MTRYGLRRRWKFRALAALTFLILSQAPVWAISADDFLPPAQADNPAEKEARLAVKDEAAVKTEKDSDLGLDVTIAPTLQDSINKIVATRKTGCRIVRMSPEDGITFVAIGMGSYNAKHANPIASRIEQRDAYVEAFMNAKQEMAKTVGEIVVRGATNFDKKVESLNTAQKSLTNIERELSEQQIETVRKVLKGYVTYAVQDEIERGRVYVSIVSSPKTRGKYSRSGTDGISADSLRDGLEALIAEIKNGLVPPVGGRIIEVPSTGEVAWVGFGSSIVRKDNEPDVQAELDVQAEQVAGMRAVDALAGIILGDDVLAESQADEQTRKQVRDFERAQESDQTTKGTKAEIREYESRKKDMRNILRTDTRVQSLRKGVLPPGIIRRTDMDENEYFAYGIAVYIPSVSDAARQGSREMDEAQIVRSPSDGRAGSQNR